MKCASSNLDVTNEPALNGLISPYVIFEMGEERVGFTSAAPPDLHSSVNDAGNITTSEVVASIRAAVGAMLDQGGMSQHYSFSEFLCHPDININSK